MENYDLATCTIRYYTGKIVTCLKLYPRLLSCQGYISAIKVNLHLQAAPNHQYSNYTKFSPKSKFPEYGAEDDFFKEKFVPVENDNRTILDNQAGMIYSNNQRSHDAQIKAFVIPTPYKL